MSAKAVNKKVFGGVYMDIKDLTGLRESCEIARDFGFNGKSLIHPNQIDICNAAFSPTADDVNKAKKIIAAFEAAASEGKSLAVVDGSLVEQLHVDQARDLLLLSEEIGIEK